MFNAGIIFTSKNHVLGCVTRKKKNRFSKETFYTSGFGGGGIKGETPIITAIRETIEEIYEFIKIPKNPKIYKNSKKFIQLKKKFKIPRNLINYIVRQIKPVFLSYEYNYYLYVCNYGNLIKMMRIIHKYILKNKNIISTIYGNKLPKTIYQLLTFQRYDFYKSNEIVKIIRVPYRNNLIIDKYFRKDINKVISYYQKNNVSKSMSQEIYLNPENEALIQQIAQQGNIYITDYIKAPVINQPLCGPLQIPDIVNPQKGSINMNGGGNISLLGGKQVVLPPNPARIIPPFPANKNSFYSLTELLQLPKEQYDIQALLDLGTIMIALQGDTGFENPMSQKSSIFPALFTYIGQFLDHDMTFVNVPNFTTPINFATLINNRTALFDLDSLFDSPAVYDIQGFLVLEPNINGVLDVPRTQEGIQIIGDVRNGENQIVLQVHMLFMKFYNKALSTIKIENPGLTLQQQIDLAKQTTRFHWQWLVINDFLKLACGPFFNSLFTSDGEPIFTNIQPDKLGALNGEFAFATYRWHSLPQELYYANGLPPLIEHPIFSPDTAILQGFNGFRPLIQDLVLDFGFFWQMQDYNGFQQSHRFGTQVSFPLGNLPNPVVEDDVVNLPQRTLQRQNQCLFASGQNFARSFGITEENIINDFNLIDPNFLYNCILPIERVNQLQTYFRGNMPLFYYILYEARTVGQGCNLGQLGSMMIGQTFLAQLFSDPTAYVFTDFLPVKGAFGCKKSYKYTFEDFIRYANDQPYPVKPIFTPNIYTNFFKVNQNFATDITVQGNFIPWILKIVSTFTIADKGKRLRIINNTRNSLSNITINVYNSTQTRILEIIELDFQDRIAELMWDGTGYIPYNNSNNQ